MLVGNPVVSLDNISVFAKKERQEQIVKNRVRYLNLFSSYGVFIGHSSRHYNLKLNFHLTLGRQMLTKPMKQVYSCVFDDLIGRSHDNLYLGMKQGKALTTPRFFFFV